MSIFIKNIRITGYYLGFFISILNFSYYYCNILNKTNIIGNLYLKQDHPCEEKISLFLRDWINLNYSNIDNINMLLSSAYFINDLGNYNKCTLLKDKHFVVFSYDTGPISINMGICIFKECDLKYINNFKDQISYYAKMFKPDLDINNTIKIFDSDYSSVNSSKLTIAAITFYIIMFSLLILISFICYFNIKIIYIKLLNLHKARDNSKKPFDIQIKELIEDYTIINNNQKEINANNLKYNIYYKIIQSFDTVKNIKYDNYLKIISDLISMHDINIIYSNSIKNTANINMIEADFSNSNTILNVIKLINTNIMFCKNKLIYNNTDLLFYNNNSNKFSPNINFNKNTFKTTNLICIDKGLVDIIVYFEKDIYYQHSNISLFNIKYINILFCIRPIIGIKSISIILLYIGVYVTAFMSGCMKNFGEIFYTINSPLFTIILSIYYVNDIMLFISAFLLVIKINNFKIKNKVLNYFNNNLHKNESNILPVDTANKTQIFLKLKVIITVLFKRYLSFLPIILFTTYILTYIFENLLFSQAFSNRLFQRFNIGCYKYGYRNLLLINNYYYNALPNSESCVDNLWYLAIDFQCYIIFTIILVLFKSFDKNHNYDNNGNNNNNRYNTNTIIKFFLYLVIFIASIILQVFVIIKHNLKYNAYSTQEDLNNIPMYLNVYETKTHNKIISFLLGIIFGEVYIYSNDWKMLFNGSIIINQLKKHSYDMCNENKNKTNPFNVYKLNLDSKDINCKSNINTIKINKKYYILKKIIILIVSLLCLLFSTVCNNQIIRVYIDKTFHYYVQVFLIVFNSIIFLIGFGIILISVLNNNSFKCIRSFLTYNVYYKINSISLVINTISIYFISYFIYITNNCSYIDIYNSLLFSLGIMFIVIIISFIVRILYEKPFKNVLLN